MRIKRRTYLQTYESDNENAIGNVFIHTNAISKRNEIATPRGVFEPKLLGQQAKISVPTSVVFQ